MAKGNLLLGMSRGKIGDIVVTRGAGEQVARARNRNPKNPQTTKQMAQRAALATVVEFFTRGRKNLFKFAFENKRKGESDYNAFVRANIGHVPVQSRKTIVENGPVVGEFILSQGSLTQPSFTFDLSNPGGSIYTGKVGTTGAALTIGKLSQLIIDANGYQAGDIITIVAIGNSGGEVAFDLETAIGNKALVGAIVPTSWVIRQFTLDPASSALASTLGIFDLAEVTAQSIVLPLSMDVFRIDFEDELDVDMLGVIVSRNTPNGLKVSTSTCKLSNSANLSAVVGRSDDWKVWVAKHWNDATSLDVAPDNILEGSISEN